MRIFSLTLFTILVLIGCKTDDKKKNTTTTTTTRSVKVKAKPFQINGNIDGLKQGYVVLKNKIDGKLITVDSTQLSNGSFTLKGKIRLPEVYALLVADDNKMYGTKSLFVEPGEIMVNADVNNIKKARISGSDSEGKLQAFKKQLQTWDDRTNGLYKKYKEAVKAGNTSEQDKINGQIATSFQEKMGFIKKHVMGNLSDPLSPYIAMTYLVSSGISESELEKIAKGFGPELDASKYAFEVKSYYNVLVKTGVGETAPNFSLTDKDGKTISLSNMKGKYVLLDFWASWCEPCREENPDILKMYNEFKGKGFTVLGVSIDTDKGAWLKALKEDKLPFANVIDVAGWDSKVGKQYGVRSIPHSLLLDKQGKIVAKNLRGAELRKKLGEILN